MNVQQYIDENNAFILEFDNVLYPEKDFILQVYYLFANFIEYSEQLPAAGILKDMKDEYEENGAEEVIAKTLTKWNIPEKYKLNFNLLLSNARLPLKLELFPKMLNFLTLATQQQKQIFLFVKGDPATQLNKIKQTHWQGIADKLVVYFQEELGDSQSDSGLPKIVNSHFLDAAKTVFISNNERDFQTAQNAGMKYLNVTKLLTH